MTYSEQIFRLKQMLRSVGWRVRTNQSLDPRAVGRIYYSKRLIDLNEPSAEAALAVLAHETGHMIDYSRRGREKGRSRRRRELLAYFYGWAVIKRLGLTISKADWQDHHRHLWEDAAWLSADYGLP